MSFDSSPYQPPVSNSWQSPTPPRTPAVWYWYVAYCVAMALLYLACVGFGVVFFAFADVLAADDPEMTPGGVRFMGGMLIAVAVPLMLLFGIAPLLRGKVGWILGFVTIGIGMTSACCLLASIPLLIFWLRPELKAYLRVK